MSATDPICPPDTAFAAAVGGLGSGAQSLDAAVTDLIGQLTEHELLWLLDGDLTIRRGMAEMADRYNRVPFEGGRIDRLGIPGIRFTDGPRGVALGASTAFPVAIARAATWDPDLERTVADAIGAEARAQGANIWAGICINLAYSPGWGRAQESYGEDPVLLGVMGAAAIEGANPWVLSCVKHFALNSMEEARFRVDVRVAEDVLREVYLPHFRTAVEAGADCVMSAYNSVNGTWAGQNRHLLTEILRDEWGFDGFVMTDFIWGLRDPIGSVAAGQDLEMPFRQQRAATLPGALRDGSLKRADVERAAHRQLAAQIRLVLRARPTPPIDVVTSAAHRRLAREVACRGAVLLRNQMMDATPALPLAEASLSRVALVGPLADAHN
ncbi:MAG: beta-glucosidase, partial [Mycobacterium sp.]|nr:beta-glucosidase [Mycobacterium sp.]